MFMCVSIAPLGLPVVPEVYRITATSVSAPRCGAAALPAAKPSMASQPGPGAGPTLTRSRSAGASGPCGMRSASEAVATTATAAH